uniref:Uncharacterized protein n=1 Tax=Meloidogyne enterolobii TaxID=390850 RepID=A0A6V7UTV9_MELEN|nr:unnamed protein product [Meloidogyne enterolobii]
MELTLVRPLEEFYTKYFNAESSILKWRIRQFIEYTLCLIDKNFDEEETQIWVEMTKHYWYGDTEMQIQYVKLKEFTVKEIKENITRYYLNMETIVEKELNPKTPSYILAVSESIQEVNKNIKIGKKNKLF